MNENYNYKHNKTVSYSLLLTFCVFMLLTVGVLQSKQSIYSLYTLGKNPLEQTQTYIHTTITYMDIHKCLYIYKYMFLNAHIYTHTYIVA